MILIQNVKRTILLSLAIFVFVAGYIVYGLNVPVRQEVLSGKVIQSYIIAGSKSAVSIAATIELENGRTVRVILPQGAELPLEGSPVIITRNIKRFFGDSFGLKE
jgi:hypothetical protein